eukprot:g3524.t1 g3524   contig12:2248609-2249297(+)
MEEDNPTSGSGPSIKLISRAGDSFELPYAAAILSQTVKDAQSCEDDEENENPDDVEIVKVESRCLEKVVEFLVHHLEEPLAEIKTPLEDNTFDGVVKQQFYRDFVKGVDQPMLFDLVTAANFMAIQPLLDLTCLQVSCQLMGKVPTKSVPSSTFPK